LLTTISRKRTLTTLNDHDVALAAEEDIRISHEWAMRIGVAQSEERLVRIANDYLATWLPSDFEVLPADCRLSSVSNADELAHFSVTFVKAELRVPHDAPASPRLVDLVRVFVAGQQRLRQLRSHNFDPAAN
jgi:hypothetical protein